MEKLIKKLAIYLSRDLDYEGHYTGIETAEFEWLKMNFYFQRNGRNKSQTYFRISTSCKCWIYFNLGFMWFSIDNYKLSGKFDRWWFNNFISTPIHEFQKFIKNHFLMNYYNCWKNWSQQFWGDNINEDGTFNPDWIEPKRPSFIKYAYQCWKRRRKIKLCNHDHLHEDAHITGDSGSADYYCPDCGFTDHITYY